MDTQATSLERIASALEQIKQRKLRDELAGRALQSVALLHVCRAIADGGPWDVDVDQIAEEAVRLADAVVRALRRRA